MKVWGISEQQISVIGDTLGLTVENVHTVGRAVSVKLTPQSSRAQYARTTEKGRHIKACCYHGFRDFVLSCFVAGATRIDSAASGSYVWDSKLRMEVEQRGSWHSATAFRISLHDLYNRQIGNRAFSEAEGNLCQCETPSMNYILGRVTDRFDPEALSIF